MKHSMRFSSRAIACLLLAPCLLLTAGALDAQSAAPGHRIFGDSTNGESLIVDSNGNVVHTWTSDINDGWANYLGADGTLLRVIVTEPLPLGGAAGGVQRVALDGTVLWDFHYDDMGNLSHHDIEELPNGNVLMIAWEEKTNAEAIAAGREPGLVGDTFRPDHIIEVRQTGLTTGEIVWEWHIFDHAIQDFDPARDNFGVVADHPELIDINFPRRNPFLGDWNHVNGIDYDPVHDRILVSSDQASEIWVIDHSTTTEEAAGHTGGLWGKGGDILYRWGNPQAYRAGTADDKVFNTQHSPRVIAEGYPGAGNYMVFVNNAPGLFNQSAVWEFVPPLDVDGSFILEADGSYGPDGPIYGYTEGGLYSSIISSVERLPNGNTLICSGTQARVLEVDTLGNTVLEYEGGGFLGSYFNADYAERWLWSDRNELSATSGGTAKLDLIAGTPYAGADYLVVATRAGTEPGVEIGGVLLPLNPDGLTRYLRDNPNSAILGNSAGTLDANGRAQAMFNLPDNSPLVAGQVLHFAYLLTDPITGAPLFASDAVPISITE